MSAAIAVILIGLGSVVRFLPHPDNAVAIGALAIFAAARLPRLWAVLVPVAALAISDVFKVLDTSFADTLLAPASLLRLATVAFIALGSSFVPRRVAPPWRLLQGAGAAVVFFLVTNFGVWVFPYGLPGEPGVYPHTFGGLVECYAMAVPFFRNSLAAEVVGVGVLFGLDALAARLVKTDPRALAS